MCQCHGIKGYTQVEKLWEIFLIYNSKQKKNMHTDRGNNTIGQECSAKRSRKETKIQEFVRRDAMSVSHEICDYSGNNDSHRTSNKSMKSET